MVASQLAGGLFGPSSFYCHLPYQAPLAPTGRKRLQGWWRFPLQIAEDLDQRPRHHYKVVCQCKQLPWMCLSLVRFYSSWMNKPNISTLGTGPYSVDRGVGERRGKKALLNRIENISIISRGHNATISGGTTSSNNWVYIQESETAKYRLQAGEYKKMSPAFLNNEIQNIQGKKAMSMLVSIKWCDSHKEWYVYTGFVEDFFQTNFFSDSR